jgi:hypothetical protein
VAPREWNISKVEWDGFTASALARAWGTAWGVAIGAGLLGVASMVVGVLLHRNGSTALGLPNGPVARRSWISDRPTWLPVDRAHRWSRHSTRWRSPAPTAGARS